MALFYSVFNIEIQPIGYCILHPLFSAKAFLIKLFKNFEEQVVCFLNATGDSYAKKKSAIQSNL